MRCRAGADISGLERTGTGPGRLRDAPVDRGVDTGDPTADEVFVERGVPVIPDILANADGVTVSCFEWLQDIDRRSWSLERVDDELEEETVGAWTDVRREFDARDVTWREAAYIVALSRVARAHEIRGLWP